MAVSFSLTLNGGGPQAAALNADLAWAAADWSQYLNANADIRVQVDVVSAFPSGLGFVIQNDSSDFVSVGTTAQGKPLVEPWGEYALQTGQHVAGSPYDIHLYLNLDDNGTTVFINRDPGNGAAVPVGQYDATTMFLKALGYGLGFAAMSTTNAAGASDEATPLDPFVQFNPNGPSGNSLGVDVIGLYELTGNVVDAVNGGPVALVTPGAGDIEANVHIGNTPTIAGVSDIMAVTQSIAGVSLGISKLDLAIMQEAGVPIVPGDLPCFAQGTLIATPRGALPVETLREGETVIDSAGREMPVKWLGWRHVDCRRHVRPEDVWPVRIEAHAFGEGRPDRALFLSRDHAVFFEGNPAAGAPDVLIPVRYLVNGASIAQVHTDRVMYWHVELGRHVLLLANGLPCESYLDTGNRAAFANGGAAVMMTPDFAFKAWDTRGCAPLGAVGPERAAAGRGKTDIA